MRSLQNFKKNFFPLFLLLFLYFLYNGFSQEDLKLSYDAFKKAETSLERIRKGRNRPFRFILKKIYLNEEEINSYIHFKNPFRRPTELIKEWLYLKDDNLIEYRANFDLTNSNIKGLPEFLKSIIEVSVSGELSSVEGKVKFKTHSFSINKAIFPPTFLTTLLNIYYKTKGEEPKDIESWFYLPYGIRKIRVEKGRIALYY